MEQSLSLGLRTAGTCGCFLKNKLGHCVNPIKMI